MTSELGDLFHHEVELAKVETREELQRSTLGAAAIAVAAVAGLLFLTLASLALAVLLDQGSTERSSSPSWRSSGRSSPPSSSSTAATGCSEVRPLPETNRSLKEDMQWAKNLRS